MLAGTEEAFQGKQRMTAIEALLDGLVDYAGLFPPAGLDMRTAVSNFARYRSGEQAWMLGRFIVPAQRLKEFAAAFQQYCCDEQGPPWLLSVLSSGSPEQDAQWMEGFQEGAVWIQSVECRTEDAADLEQRGMSTRRAPALYVEFSSRECRQVLPVVQRLGLRAKLRTGGLTPDAFPEADEVARFLVSCAEARVAFKATAGLHHPLRSVQKLTYEPESASAWMHGFINLFVAAVVAYFGAGLEEVRAVLLEESPSAFAWSPAALTWHGKRFSTDQIREVRQRFAISFGSCSFTEPVDDLKALGWL
ncbi:MAG: hypothetical protein IRZ03_07010 [Acidobacterium ailaaui]|nr:hypothetical protein [Pseudacidobacterium ailaaui]